MENNNIGEGVGILILFILMLNALGFLMGIISGVFDDCDDNVPYINFGYKFGCYFVGNDYPITK